MQVEEAGEQLEADAALAVELLLAGDAGAAEVGAGLVDADVDLEDVVDLRADLENALAKI